MIDDRRLAAALAAGFVPLLALAVMAMFTPTGAFSLAGDVDSPGARLALDDLHIDRLDLDGATVDGVETAQVSIGEIERSTNLVIERDVDVSSVVPGGEIYTLRVAAPTAELSGLELTTSRACVDGVGLTGLGLLEGFADPIFNDALADGYDPSPLSSLFVLLGPTGLVDIRIEEFRAELLSLEATSIAAEGIETSFGPRRTDPAFVGSCVG